MHQHHDHPHDHDHDHAHDPAPNEAPLDAANQSLADALRASFGILKVIMAVLFVLYLASNVRRVDSHEQALRLRFGALDPQPDDAGLVWAFPFPIDEIVTLPTRKSNELQVDSHTFHRSEQEKGKPLAMIARAGGEGLNPALDGALLTADSGLVHARWKVTYKIDDVVNYVSNLKSRQVEAAEELIRVLVENVGIHVAGELTAEQIIRTNVDVAQSEMTRRINEKLNALSAGIRVTRVEMYEPTPPLQVRPAFDNTQRAENTKRTQIREAEQERTRILSESAGAGYAKILQVLDAIQNGGTEHKPTDALKKELRELLTLAEGEAGQEIKDASAFLSKAVGQMQSDVELYRTLLPEYERNPQLLKARLWEQTKNEVMTASGVTKLYFPLGAQIRLQIPLDPEQTRIEEAKRLQKKEFDIGTLRPEKWVPLGPDDE